MQSILPPAGPKLVGPAMAPKASATAPIIHSILDKQSLFLHECSPMHRFVLTVTAVLLLLAVGGVASLRAEEAFQVDPLFTKNCARCHNINGINSVCPDLSTIGERRDAAYIRESIMEPNAYIVPGFPRDVMPKFSLILQPEEIDQLVKFLLTLKGQAVDPERVKKGVKW